MASARVPEAVANECLALIFQMQFARRLDTIEAECADSPERILNASTVLQPDRSDCLFLTLVLLWVGSKMFETQQISLTELKACSSRIISDKVYTAKDFVKATINFEIETGRSCPSVLEDLLRELRRVSRVGDFIKLSTCFTIYTLMHSDSVLRQHLSRAALPASIIVSTATSLMPWTV
ncbi:unnamed protein product [Closterium sp. Yama58-4]|nr:unnamed protein product [Closterium sp. Yama58-4]